MKRKCEWSGMSNPVSVSVAANDFGWSELNIWILIRKGKLRWSYRGSDVVIDKVEMYRWTLRNRALSESLQEKVGVDKKHPLTGRV